MFSNETWNEFVVFFRQSWSVVSTSRSWNRWSPISPGKVGNDLSFYQETWPLQIWGILHISAYMQEISADISFNVSWWRLLSNRFPPCPSFSRCLWYMNYRYTVPAWCSAHFWVFLCVSASFVFATLDHVDRSQQKYSESFLVWSSLVN